VWPGCDSDPSNPSSAVVKKGQRNTSTPPWAVQPVQSLSACTTVHFWKKKVGWGDVEWIHVAQDRSQWWDSVKTVMDIKIPHTAL